ncbi:hypothetical protein [Streptomyces sp. bgisy027]
MAASPRTARAMLKAAMTAASARCSSRTNADAASTWVAVVPAEK